MKIEKIFLFVILLFSNVAQAQTIYVSPSEALKTIFHSSEEIVTDKKSLNDSQKISLKKTLGRDISRTDWTFYIAKSKNKIDGYALIDNEIGKTEPITFLTAITNTGQVKHVEVLVYREPYGSEVHQKIYLKQYQAKSLSDPIRVGQDIKHIAGATLSSRAISTGVKRALAVWTELYGSK